MPDQQITTAARERREATTTIVLSFLTAVLEGVDLQAMGVAAPRVMREFSLSPGQMGLIFTAGTIGLFIGAMVGGRAADRFGRKRVLVGAVVLFGLFSIISSFAWNLNSLIVGRFATGCGLGAGLPMLIALVAEASTPARRASNVTLIYAGAPLGGALAAAVGLLSAGELNWRAIFLVGGIGPLLFAPVLMLFLSESRKFQTIAEGSSASGISAALFGEGRALKTILLWITFFCSLLCLYLLQNWLPSLTIGRGFSPVEAGQTQIAFNLGGAGGAVLLSMIMARAGPGGVLIGTFAGTAAGLMALGWLPPSLVGMLLSALFVGIVVNGSLFILYGLAPTFYSTPIRGTGVGAAVAAGRIGAIVGPLLAASLIGAGRTASEVLIGILPIVLAAFVAGIFLVLPPNESRKAQGD